jgi:hypothetical protein
MMARERQEFAVCRCAIYNYFQFFSTQRLQATLALHRMHPRATHTDMLRFPISKKLQPFTTINSQLRATRCYASVREAWCR